MLQEARLRTEQKQEAVLREVRILHTQLDLRLVQPLLADSQLLESRGDSS